MTYYHFVRSEIRPLLPKTASRILDVGAASGATLGWLKTIYPSARTTGLELNPELTDELKRNADVAIIGDIDDQLPQLGTFDLILFLDVLEHIADPDRTLRSARKLLRQGGRVIVSVPNIAHLSVLVPLLRRRFDYQHAGILDRTHLRFFVESTAVKLLNDANLVVTQGLVSGLQGRKSALLDRLSLGLLRHYLTKQYIMVGESGDGQLVQPPVRWQVAE
jgi:2-polyprenyl-3-methyl-5-hydroxy-6-metoxy-1,4-benzoquinol methylase